MFRRKPQSAEESTILNDGGFSQYQAKMAQERAERLASFHERTAALEAELAAIEPPSDLYQIRKRFEDGTYGVWKWAKSITWEPLIGPLTSDGYDYREVEQGHQALKLGLPSQKAAEGWLKAYLDPKTNQTGYDANGKRLEASDAEA